MKKLSGIAAFAAAMAFAQTASAAVQIEAGPDVVQPGENIQLDVDLTPGDATLRGTSNQTNATILFTAGEAVASPPQGQARIEALDSNGLNSLIISLENGGTFNEAEFNVLADVAGSITISVFGVGGSLLQAASGSLNPWTTDVGTSGQNFFGIIADASTPISSIEISSGTGTQISSIGQFRLGGVDGLTLSPVVTGVPEPASWATLLFGFGALGLMMRRRKSSNEGRSRVYLRKPGHA